MGKFRFLIEPALYHILFDFFHPKTVLMVYSLKGKELRELNGELFMELPGECCQNFVVENGKMCFWEHFVLPGSISLDRRKFLEIDLYTGECKETKDRLVYKSKPCPIVKVQQHTGIDEITGLVANKVVLTKVENPQETKVFELKEPTIFISETRDFVHLQFEKHAKMINKHTFKFVSFAGYWNCCIGPSAPNVFFSNGQNQVFEIDREMRVDMYTTKGIVRGVASTF